MNDEPIHTEILFNVTYNKSFKNFKNYVFDLIDEMEAIKSYCTGGEGSYVVASGQKDITEKHLVKILINHIYKNITEIEEFNFEIYRYNDKGKRIHKKKYKS